MIESKPFRPLVTPPTSYPYPFRREVDASIRLLRFTKGYLEGLRLPFLQPVDQAVQVDAIRATTTYEAILHLALDGFGMQAEMLLRPLIEAALTAQWAHRNPTVVEDRYVLHREYCRSLWLAARRDSGLFKDDPRLHPLPPVDEESAKEMFGRHGERSWTGLSIRQMFEQLGLGSGDSPDAFHWRAYITVLLPFVNWILHSSGMSLWGMDREASGEGVTITIGPSEARVRETLSVAWAPLALAIDALDEHFQLNWEHERGSLLFDVWAAFYPPEAIRSLGRNDPCPCRSGRKFKNCHDNLRR